MTLPVSGAISLNQVNVELGLSGTTSINMNQASVRTLFGVPSGAISMSNGYGKSNRAVISSTISANTANAVINLSSISGYVAGKSDITVTINSGVYVYSTTTGGAGLTFSNGTTGDTLTVVNNGRIMGQGGVGGVYNNVPAGNPGGPAISLSINTTINNTNGAAYIGGGGGGGRSSVGSIVTGGGGAGGGAGGSATAFGMSGGAGGGIGASGGNGSASTDGDGNGFGNGGGGGRIFPGTGGAGGTDTPYANWAGKGGGAGGGGSAYNDTFGGAGGSANAAGAGANGDLGSSGGGGWGASGGGGGAAGGRAVQLNGRTVTWVSGVTARVYGAVS